jgi:hypothetical protein
MSDDKTHYRKAFHSPYLGAADIVDPVVLTVRCVRLESDKTKKTRDMFNTAYFQEAEIRPGEKLKPMILNATNSKKLAELAGSKFIEDWNGIPITVYVDPNVSFGRDKVEGLRISRADAIQAPTTELIEAAESSARKGLKAYQEWFKSISTSERKAIAQRHESLKRIASEVQEPAAEAKE